MSVWERADILERLRESLTEKVTFDYTFKKMREVVCRYLEEEKSKREDKSKDLELGTCLVCSRDSEEAF